MHALNPPFCAKKAPNSLFAGLMESQKPQAWDCVLDYFEWSCQVPIDPPIDIENNFLHNVHQILSRTDTDAKGLLGFLRPMGPKIAIEQERY